MFIKFSPSHMKRSVNDIMLFSKLILVILSKYNIHVYIRHIKVTSIAANALRNTRAKEIIIGKYVKKIGDRAFKGARSKKIILKAAQSKLKIGDQAFRVKYKRCVIKINPALKSAKTRKIIDKIKSQIPFGVRVE